MTITDVRSGIEAGNLQEIIDAGADVGRSLEKGQQQYQTPAWLARGCAALLPWVRHDNAVDFQCAEGNLLHAIQTSTRYGIEIDQRFAERSGTARSASAEWGEVKRITGNCVQAMETMDDLFPHVRFACIVANPPFGLSWLVKTDSAGKRIETDAIDSTDWTWRTIKKRLAQYGCGFLIANAATIERLGIDRDPIVYLYQRLPGGGVWEACTVELGIVHFYNKPGILRHIHHWDHVPHEREFVTLSSVVEARCQLGMTRPWQYGEQLNAWNTVASVLKEENSDKPKWNIYLDKDGMLRTYLSTRSSIKIKRDEIEKLTRINRCHPLTLTTEKETRRMLHTYLTNGVYTIEPAARKAINDALLEVASIACPILPITDFERVAYADEEDTLKCIAADPRRKVTLTPGKRYEVRTGTYTFKDEFTRKKIYFDERTGKTEAVDHEHELTGEDRFIEITDDRRCIHRFMDRPTKGIHFEHPEELLWQFFEKPYVPTVAEVQATDYERNKRAMEMNERLAGFTYFEGQRDYYARMGCKDYGLVAADVGTGKSLGALTLIALKSPRRTLLIAPQGTMRSVGDEDEIDYEASQWVREIQRFAPTEPVFQLFGVEDWQSILHANGGQLPPGVYITYPQAYFQNGGFENLPESWENEEEKRFCERYALKFDPERPSSECFHRNVGAANEKGIRCVAEPTLATQIAAAHGDCWDMVILDEAHLCCNLDSCTTKKLLRLQPKYRFAMTATPIPNIVSNIFSLMGWVCVKDWYKGDRRNAAWPYAVDEIGRFNQTFLSTETDITAQEQAKAAKKKGWRRVGIRFSPIISSPARLLKLLKPTLAYISKEACNPNLQPCEVIDVRVATGKDQTRLYQYWLNRGNYFPEFKNPLTIAQVQSQRLRGICAAPASLEYTRGMCKSNFNPKLVTILQLASDCLGRGEQVVIVSARVDQSSALAARLSEAGIAISRIDSTVPPALHTAEANRFKKGDSRVMLMGIKCAQGFSFEQCPNLIIGSLEWSYGTLHQAKGRVWRLNSPRPVRIWCVLHKNTIEELLFDRVALKQDAATLCLHGRRIPRDFKTLDPSEILAEHIINYDAGHGQVLTETECESQWPELRKRLVVSNRMAA